MKKLQLAMLITLFFSANIFSQTLIELRRGDDVSKAFSIRGNYTNDTLVFVVKSDFNITSPKLIEKKNPIGGGTGISSSYNSLTRTTSIVVFIGHGDTQSLTPKNYVYDLKAYNSVRTVTVATGIFLLKPSVQSSEDITYNDNDTNIVVDTVLSGTATIPAGSSSVIVTHDLGQTPSMRNMNVWCYDWSRGNEFKVTNVNDTTFTILLDSTIALDTVTYDLHYSWQIFNTNTTTNSQVGRGTIDTDIVFIKLRSPDGTAYYIYPANGGGGLTISTTKP